MTCSGVFSVRCHTNECPNGHPDDHPQYWPLPGRLIYPPSSQLIPSQFVPSTPAGGKDFAKRSSMWDLIFMGWRWGRDEQLVTVVLRWLMQLLMNFTLGLIGALFVFVWRLWGLIAAYKPDPLTAAMVSL